MKNQVTYRLWGRYGLFTDPITKLGGEKSSYPIPTYQAIKGITESIYWKPTLTYIVDEIRVLNPIRMESKGIRPAVYTDSGGSNLAYYSYLSRPCYEVKVHFVFNRHRPDLKHDWNENKHYQILKRCIERGGRRDIFLGARECQGYIEPCEYGRKAGAYDEMAELSFGTMVHGLSYPDETGKDELTVRLWQPVMKNGVITFIKPEDCLLTQPIKKMKKKIIEPESFQSAASLWQQMEADE